MNTEDLIVTSPLEVIWPPTDVVMVGSVVAMIDVALTPAPRPPAPDLPDDWVRARASLSTSTVEAAETVPLNEVLTVPSDLTVGTMMPTPAPSPAASENASTDAGAKDWLLTVTALVALTVVPMPTPAETTGESVANSAPPATPAARPMLPSERRANAGATVTVWLSPRNVL